MTAQFINMNTPVLPDPDRMKWMEANGLDPYLMPADQVVVVEDGKITFTKFKLVNGAKVMSHDERGYLKETLSVPLKVDPAEFGIVEPVTVEAEGEAK